MVCPDNVRFSLGRREVPGDDRPKHRRGVTRIAHEYDNLVPRRSRTALRSGLPRRSPCEIIQPDR